MSALICSRASGLPPTICHLKSLAGRLQTDELLVFAHESQKVRSKGSVKFEPWPPPQQNPGGEGGRRGHREGVRAAADGEVVDVEPADQDEGDYSIEGYLGFMTSVQY